MAWIPAVIGGATSLISAFSDDDSSSTVSSTNTPATWGDVGVGGERLWNDFINSIYGQVDIPNELPTEIQTKINDYGSRIREARQKIQEYEKSGLTVPSGIEGDIFEAQNAIQALIKEYAPDIQYTPGLEDAIAEDEAYKKSASDKYLEDMGVITGDFKTGKEGISNEYLANSQRLQSNLAGISEDAKRPYTSVNVMGSKTPIVSRRGISLAETLSDIANKDFSGTALGIAGRNDTLNDIYSADTALSKDTLAAGETYTPNKAKMEYLSTMWPIISQLQGFRFGTPSTSATATAPTSLTENITDSVKLGTSVYDLLKDALNQNKTDEG